MWSKIKEDDSFGDGYENRIAVITQDLISSFENDWDVMPDGRHKKIHSIALQMFCLQNTQMFVCVKNSRTNIDCFCVYLSVMDNKYFDVVFTLNKTLNLLKNKHFLSNLQKNVCCFYKLFSYWQNFLSFFAGYEIWIWSQQKFVCDYSSFQKYPKIDVFV